MKKNFFTIYFSFILLLSFNCAADLIPINEDYENQIRIRQMNMKNQEPIHMPDPNNQEEVRAFFKKRFEVATRTVISDKTKLGSQTAVGVIHTPEYYEAQKKKEKSIFQRMYDQVIKSLQDQDEDSAKDNEEDVDPVERELATTATRFFTLAEPDEQTKRRNTFPTVSVTLPSGRKILAPAREHIAYFLSYIDIQANGYVKIEDTITVVANNQRLAWGLNRVFAKNAQKNQKIDFILESVTINDTEVPYIIEEIGDNIVLTPKYNHKLEPGVYTYKFNYVVNNKLLRQDDTLLLDWSITGRPLKLFVTSANAIISVPSGHSFDDVAAVVGSKSHYTNRRTNRFDLAGNVVAFSNYTPLFQGEDMHIVAAVNKNVFFKDFDKNFSHFITNWGNILYAALGLAAILISFILSLVNLKHDKKKQKNILRRITGR